MLKAAVMSCLLCQSGHCEGRCLCQSHPFGRISPKQSDRCPVTASDVCEAVLSWLRADCFVVQSTPRSDQRAVGLLRRCETLLAMTERRSDCFVTPMKCIGV